MLDAILAPDAPSDIAYLDFACGTGRVLGHLERRVGAATGVDVSASMLEVARQHVNGATLVLADITREACFPEGTFDLVTAFRFFPRAEPELRGEALAAIRRVLKPGGRLVFNNHLNRNSLRNRLKRALRVGTVVGMDHVAVQSLLSTHGLRIERVYPLGLWPSSDSSPAWLVPLIESAERLVERTKMPFASVANDLIYVCRTVETGHPPVGPADHPGAIDAGPVMIARIAFWTAAALVAYAYAGFPLLLLVRGLVVRRPVRSGQTMPRASVVVVAHNEAATIGAKLENLLSLDYPRERLDIVVASDGSTDDTEQIVARYRDRGVRLLAYPRSGKIPALNAAVTHATGDVLVFSDANSFFRGDALGALLAPFADASVGAVGGNQCYADGDSGHVASAGERLYWSFDRVLKRMQSGAGNMTSATGAIHAIRRELFQPVPLGVGDDFLISTRVISRGYRLIFAPDAVAYERVAASEHAEFRRKVRVIVRGLRGLWEVRDLFNPARHGFYSVQLFSHKLLRWSVCWLLLLLCGMSLVLLPDRGVYAWAGASQLGFYGCAVAGWRLRRTSLARFRIFRVCAVPLYFCLANYAALCAWPQVLRGRRLDVWDSQRATHAPGEAAETVRT